MMSTLYISAIKMILKCNRHMKVNSQTLRIVFGFLSIPSYNAVDKCIIIIIMLPFQPFLQSLLLFSFEESSLA